MYQVIKRIFDFICAFIALVALSPIFLFTILGILISDWGPIFYKANRIGKGNKPFKMYKFRSMKVLKAPKKGAEASLRPDEDRIFPFGHFIRKAKIDELPQLINILNGSMSIIGPRPVAEDQFDMFQQRDIDFLISEGYISKNEHEMLCVEKKVELGLLKMLYDYPRKKEADY